MNTASKFQAYKIGSRNYFYYNDSTMVKYADPDHRARKNFGGQEDWSQGSWGIDYDAFRAMHYEYGLERWIVKENRTGRVWGIYLEDAERYGTVATLHPSDGEQLFVPIARFELLEEA